MADDTVRIMCPNLLCRKILAVPKTARGKTVRCRRCQTNIRVPAPVPAAMPPIPASADPGAGAKKPV